MTQTIQRKLNDSAFARWAAVILISLMMFFAYMFVDMMSPLQSLIEGQRGWSPDVFGAYGSSEYLLNVFGFLIIAGIIIVATNIAPLIRGIVNLVHKEKGGLFDTIVSAIAIALGVLLIIKHGGMLALIINILLAVYLIVLPIIRIIIAPSKKEQLAKEWLRILIGAILLAFLPLILDASNTIFSIILTIAGVVVLVLTILSFALSLVAYIKASKKTEDAPVEVEAEATEEAAE